MLSGEGYAAEAERGEDGATGRITRVVILAIDRETEPPEPSEGERRSLLGMADRDSAIVLSLPTEGDIRVVDLGRRDRALRIASDLPLGQRELPHPRRCTDVEGVTSDPTIVVDDDGIDPDDLRDECARELRTESTLGTSGVPDPEHQSRRAEFVEGRRIPDAHRIEPAPDLRLAEGDAIEETVPENRIGEPVRGL